MGAAIDAHHAVVRRVLAAHEGYEVKTVGDSFMAAFLNAADAVEFALRLQSALVFDVDWNAVAGGGRAPTADKPQASPSARDTRDAFQAVYAAKLTACATGGADGDRDATGHEKTQPSRRARKTHHAVHPQEPGHRVNSDRDTESLSTTPFVGALPLDPLASMPEGRRKRLVANQSNPMLWRGLRVQIGVHSGVGMIRRDAATGAYDYYGTVVNCGARGGDRARRAGARDRGHAAAGPARRGGSIPAWGRRPQLFYRSRTSLFNCGDCQRSECSYRQPRGKLVE
jgi:hypothetical protein